ncbi:hypothetical protein VT84_09570 [Gemmata sp. SH-PL17]|nr:hypothetical protein VT84_09570 [Gemmata sp. SH-PL17]
MTSAELLARGRELFASLALSERDALLAAYAASGARRLTDLAYSPLMRRMRTDWCNQTGREWTEPEFYYCLYAAIRSGDRP